MLFTVKPDQNDGAILGVNTWYMVGCTCLWYRLIIDCLVQVGAWLMHLFMVQVDYSLRYSLMHG